MLMEILNSPEGMERPHSFFFLLTERKKCLLLQHQDCKTGTSLAVLWLRLCTSSAGYMGSIPGRGSKIPHVAWPKEKRLQDCSDEAFSDKLDPPISWTGLLFSMASWGLRRHRWKLRGLPSSALCTHMESLPCILLVSESLPRSKGRAPHLLMGGVNCKELVGLQTIPTVD